MVQNNFVYGSDNGKVYFPDIYISMKLDDKVVKRYLEFCYFKMESQVRGHNWNPPERELGDLPSSDEDLRKLCFYTKGYEGQLIKAKKCEWDSTDFSNNLSVYDYVLPIARDYFGVIPFIPCVMINLSPQWKDMPGSPKWLNHPGTNFGRSSKQSQEIVERFKQVIETYSKSCNRWSACKL